MLLAVFGVLLCHQFVSLPYMTNLHSSLTYLFFVLQTNMNMRSSPPNIYAQSHGVRAFSWQPWTSKPAPADTLTTPPPPEDAFLKDEPISTPTSPDSSISVSDSVPSSSGPAPDTSLVSSLTDASATLPDLAASTMVPALQHGDMAALGLTGISPPGLICSLLENVHLATGMTWVSTLAVTTVGLRMLLIWPQIRSSRAAARMQPHQARLEAIGVESMEAMKSGDRDRAMALTLERKKIHHDAGIKMSDMFIGPLSMLPVQLGLFFAVKRLCDTPLPQLAAESWQWIPSLASPDPTWLLPILSAASIQASLAIGVKDAANEKAGHTMNAIRVISVVGLPFMVTLDAVSLRFYCSN
jgi:YidC/Oxa1 family membrane protein insertase